MKSFVYCFIVVLCGCSQSFYFKTPNDVFRKKGIILLNDSTRLTGELIIPFEDNFTVYLNSPSFIKIIPEGKTTEEIVPLGNIAGYYMDSSFYPLKSVYLFIDQREHLLFVKRLSPENSKIQLYLLHQTGKSNPTGDETDDYFISLPGSGPYETINTRTVRIIPDFDVKMSAFVHDCPALADKIRLRQNGYFIPFVSINRFKHKEVLMKIIEEYNKCQ